MRRLVKVEGMKVEVPDDEPEMRHASEEARI